MKIDSELICHVMVREDSDLYIWAGPLSGKPEGDAFHVLALQNSARFADVIADDISGHTDPALLAAAQALIEAAREYGLQSRRVSTEMFGNS